MGEMSAPPKVIAPWWIWFTLLAPLAFLAWCGWMFVVVQESHREDAGRAIAVRKAGIARTGVARPAAGQHRVVAHSGGLGLAGTLARAVPELPRSGQGTGRERPRHSRSDGLPVAALRGDGADRAHSPAVAGEQGSRGRGQSAGSRIPREDRRGAGGAEDRDAEASDVECHPRQTAAVDRFRDRVGGSGADHGSAASDFGAADGPRGGRRDRTGHQLERRARRRVALADRS